MKTTVLILSLVFSGCVNASLVCPDKVSTVTYRGVSLTGNTALSCVGSPGGGNVVAVTGIDLLALAATVAPLVAARSPQPPPPPSPAP